MNEFGGEGDGSEGIRNKGRSRIFVSEGGMNIRIKRVYESPDKGEGTRILVDRLWPRGLSREKAQVDLWLKDVAPSTELRKWFDHDPEKWQEFRKRYRAELEKNKEQVAALGKEIEKGPVMLVYGSRDTEHNEARVLLDFLTEEEQGIRGKE